MCNLLSLGHVISILDLNLFSWVCIGPSCSRIAGQDLNQLMEWDGLAGRNSGQGW